LKERRSALVRRVDDASVAAKEAHEKWWKLRKELVFLDEAISEWEKE